jgi:hypothetical protein
LRYVDSGLLVVETWEYEGVLYAALVRLLCGSCASGECRKLSLSDQQRCEIRWYKEHAHNPFYHSITLYFLSVGRLSIYRNLLFCLPRHRMPRQARQSEVQVATTPIQYTLKVTALLLSKEMARGNSVLFRTGDAGNMFGSSLVQLPTSPQKTLQRK